MEMRSLQKDKQWTYKCQVDIESKEVWALKERGIGKYKENPLVDRHRENTASASGQPSVTQSGAIWLLPQEMMFKDLTLKNPGWPAP